jgi:hypothetical protein
VSGDASVVLKIYTASNHDNARAATPLVAAAQVERRSSQPAEFSKEDSAGNPKHHESARKP